MIAKISQGRGFRGALNYIFRQDAVPEFIGGNMAGNDPRSLAKEFGSTRRLREDIRAPCYHVSLSLPAGEHLSGQEWEEIAAGYLTKMGLDPLNHQHIVTRHRDGAYDHIHIVTSRVGLDGSVWKPYQDRFRSKDICRQLEKEHGLTVVPSEKKSYRAQTTQKERRMSERTGREPEKVFVQKAMNELLPEGAFLSPQVFCSELEKRGIIAIPNIATTGKVSGFAFQYGGRNYTGSKVGYAWKHLEKFIEIAPEDTAWMQARKSRLQEGTPSDAVRSIRNAIWEVGIQGIPFDTALEKQGWTLEGDRLKKDTIEYSLSSIVDTGMLQANLKTLEGFSKKTKAKAQAKSRELAKHYHAPRRKSFMSEMRTEDVICGLMMFPEVAVFLVVLSVLTETIRRMEKPRNEAEFKAHMKAIWEQSNTAVLEEVKRTQEAIKNAGTARRIASRNKTNQPVIKDTGREPEKESGGREPSVRELGTAVDQTLGGVEGYPRRTEGGQGLPALETKNAHSNDGDGLHRGGSSSSVEPVPARSQQSHVQVNTISGAIAEWANLAQDLAILTGDEKQMEKTASTKAKESAWKKQDSVFNDGNDFVRYRITCVPRGEKTEADIEDGEGRWAWVPGQRGDTEQFFTAVEVKEKIPMLARKNMEGYDIYVRPMTSKYIYVMIDDINTENLNKMKADGYRPNAVWRTSTDNHQVVFKMAKSAPRHYGDPLPQGEEDAGAHLVRELTAAYHGDTKNLGVKKSFRLAGYSNKKPDRHGEFTEITETSAGECPKLRDLLKVKTEMAVTANIQTETEDRRAYLSGKKSFVMDKSMAASADCVQAYMKQNRKAEGLVKYKGWTHDQSTVDFRVCVAMLQEGWHPDSVADCLERLSPELPERHRNTSDYVERTMRAAIGAVEKEQVKKQSQSRAGQSGPSFFGL